MLKILNINIRMMMIRKIIFIFHPIMIKINFNRNDTINTIAESIFVNLNDDLFKTRFMELSTDVKRKLKVYSPLLLEKLHEDLELFSWTDLLLLENIFHFSVKDINGKVFSFKEIEIMFLRCDDFNITFNKVFAENLADNDFCSYLIDNLMDFIKKRFDRVLSNSSFALPSLRPREEVNSNISEDEQLGFTRLEKENPGLIDINYDIDGFSFCIHSYEEGDICTNFHLEFNETKETQIFSKRPICEVLKVSMSDLYHCKIGECSTHMGRVSVFFVIPSVNDNFNTSEFVEQLYTAAGKNVSSRDKITCVIPVNGLLLFFSTMKFNYPTSFIFLESYGNKAYLSSRSFSSIYSTLKTIFSERIIMEMNIDIGLTVTVEDGKALFLEPDAFKLLSVIPNYKLFFCDSMGNYHKRYFNLCNRVLTYGYGPVRKINFYSLFEDCFSNFRKLSFFPSISFNMIKNNFYGFVYKLKEVRNFEEVIGDAFEKLRSENRIGYRLELTTTGMFVPVIFNVIDSFVRRDIWLSINLNVCRDIIVGNINLMIGLIGGNTILDLGRNVILETIIKEFYVKGCKTNKHFLPDSVIPQIKGLYNRAGIRYLGNLNNFQYKVEDIVQMLYKVISITNNHLNDDFCNIVNSFLFILSSASLNNSVCVIINQYIVDNIRYFKILHQVKLNYNSLEDREALLDIKEGSISLSYYLGHFFVGDFPKDNNFSYYFMIKLLKEKFNLDTNQFLDIVYTMFRRYRLNLVFKPVKKGHTGKILIPVNLGTKVVSIINKSEYISRLDSEVETFKRVVNLPSLTSERANWSEEDKTRLIHGLIKYSGSNSRWSLIKANFVYGLYLTRSPKNAHSDAYKNILRKNSLYRYVELAIRWRPENHCWGDHLRSFKVQIPEDEPFRRTYKDLYNFDLENFSHITSDDLENFFYGFLQQRYISYDEYDSLLGRLLERGDNSQALSNPFLNEQYQPFDFNSNETVFILQRPLNNNIPQPVEVLNASPISEASPAASHQTIPLPNNNDRENSLTLEYLNEKLNRFMKLTTERLDKHYSLISRNRSSNNNDTDLTRNFVSDTPSYNIDSNMLNSVGEEIDRHTNHLVGNSDPVEELIVSNHDFEPGEIITSIDEDTVEVDNNMSSNFDPISSTNDFEPVEIITPDNDVSLDTNLTSTNDFEPVEIITPVDNDVSLDTNLTSTNDFEPVEITTPVDDDIILDTDLTSTNDFELGEITTPVDDDIILDTDLTSNNDFETSPTANDNYEDENIISLNNDLIYTVKIKLKKKFGKKVFSANESRSTCWISRKRASLGVWNRILTYLCDENFLTEKIMFKKGSSWTKYTINY